jgi:hypothetical protein
VKSRITKLLSRKPAEAKPATHVPPMMIDCRRPMSTPPTTMAAPPIALTPVIDRFWGACIRLFQVDVLVVYVWPTLLRNKTQRQNLVAAFSARFARPIVLAAVDDKNVASYFGPAPITQVLGRIPFEALAWRRYRFATPTPMMLPIPAEPPREDSSDSSDERYSYLPTVIRDPDQEETRR